MTKLNTNLSWDEYYIKLAYSIAEKSKDTSSKIGSILVKNNFITSAGYNGMPIAINDNLSYRYEKPEKYFWFEHSERNAIYAAARNGLNTSGSHLYTLSIPCNDCARGCIQAGVHKITYHLQHNNIFISQNDKWAESTKRSLSMFLEAGVEINFLDKILNIQTLINGKVFNV